MAGSPATWSDCLPSCCPGTGRSHASEQRSNGATILPDLAERLYGVKLQNELRTSHACWADAVSRGNQSSGNQSKFGMLGGMSTLHARGC
jgi:hypothetical protein